MQKALVSLLSLAGKLQNLFSCGISRVVPNKRTMPCHIELHIFKGKHIDQQQQSNPCLERPFSDLIQHLVEKHQFLGDGAKRSRIIERTASSVNYCTHQSLICNISRKVCRYSPGISFCLVRRVCTCGIFCCIKMRLPSNCLDRSSEFVELSTLDCEGVGKLLALLGLLLLEPVDIPEGVKVRAVPPVITAKKYLPVFLLLLWLSPLTEKRVFRVGLCSRLTTPEGLFKRLSSVLVGLAFLPLKLSRNFKPDVQLLLMAFPMIVTPFRLNVARLPSKLVVSLWLKPVFVLLLWLLVPPVFFLLKPSRQLVLFLCVREHRQAYILHLSPV